MPKVKTFTSDLRIFKTIGQLDALDAQVNAFIEREGVRSVHSVSDAVVTADTGATIGVIRVLAYD